MQGWNKISTPSISPIMNIDFSMATKISLDPITLSTHRSTWETTSSKISWIDRAHSDQTSTWSGKTTAFLTQSKFSLNSKIIRIQILIMEWAPRNSNRHHLWLNRICRRAFCFHRPRVKLVRLFWISRVSRLNRAKSSRRNLVKKALWCPRRRASWGRR